MFADFSQSGKNECLKILLNACSDENKKIPGSNNLNEPDGNGETVLHKAVSLLDHNGVKMIVDMGADVNSRDNFGNAPLHKLVNAGKNYGSSLPESWYKTAETLLSSPGIDIYPHNVDKVLPCGQHQFSSKELKTIIDANGTEERPLVSHLSECIINEDRDEIENIVTRIETQNLKISSQYFGSQTLLHHLVQFTDADIIQKFVELGCNPWMKNIHQELPLQAALFSGDPNIVDVLLTSMKKEQGKTYIDLTEYSFQFLNILITSGGSSSVKPGSDHTECLRRLLKKDVIIDVNKDKNGNSPLLVASILNHQEAMKMLLTRGAYIGVKRNLANHDSEGILGAIVHDTVDRALESCVSVRHSKNYSATDVIHPEFSLQIDYSFFLEPVDPSSEQTTQLNSMNLSSYQVAETILDLADHNNHHASLQHPVLDALLDSKWSSIFSLITFNAFFSAFFLLLVISLCIFENLNINYPSEGYDEAINVMAYVITIFAAPLALRETVEFLTSFNSYYKTAENYLEWYLLVSAMVICYVPLSETDTTHLTAWTTLIAL